MKLILGGLLVTSLCVSCGSSEGQEILAASTPEATVINVIEYDLENRTGPVYGDNWLYDIQHKDEILQTLQVVEVDTLQDRAAVFVTWSVGAKVFREAYMLKQVGDVWALTADRMTYFSEYDDSWQDDPVALFDKQLIDWEEESASRFELRNWSSNN